MGIPLPRPVPVAVEARERWRGPRRGPMGGTLALCLGGAACLAAVGSLLVSGLGSEPSFAATPEATATVRPSTPPVTQVASAGEDDIIVLTKGAMAPIEANPLLFPGAADGVRALIMASATANNLPYDFFFRLLHQESGLNPNAVSPAGALGIAQFMPGTALDRGLRNPFDPGEAIPKSAELLREHQARFGNLGLAAAAYNAGPKRVLDWLDGRAGMPAETRDYVLRITGRAIETWVPAGRQASSSLIPAFYASQGAGLFFASPGLSPRRPAAAEARKPLIAPVRLDRQAKRLDARAKSVRAEQALCAALNSEGQTCLIQTVY